MSSGEEALVSTAARRGLFLAFEGVEGSGKSTQVRRLAAYLVAQGIAALVAREPGSTPLGERIRETTLNDPDLVIPARSELFLMLAARAAFVEQVVLPALERGQVVIADRFELSTLAYQGAGRGLPLGEVRRCNRLATGGLRPDATIFFDLDADEGVRRQQEAGKVPDRLEREEREFHLRVARGYRRLAKRIPGILPVDGRGSVDAVHRRVIMLLGAHFPETFPRPRVITDQDSAIGAEGRSSSSQTASEGE